jgi:hypothetical protein
MRRQLEIDALGGARPILNAGAAPHAGLFSLLAQRKETKRKGTPRLGLRFASTPLRSSLENGRCGTPSLSSVKQSSRWSVF